MGIAGGGSGGRTVILAFAYVSPGGFTVVLAFVNGSPGGRIVSAFASGSSGELTPSPVGTRADSPPLFAGGALGWFTSALASPPCPEGASGLPEVWPSARQDPH